MQEHDAGRVTLQLESLDLRAEAALPCGDGDLVSGAALSDERATGGIVRAAGPGCARTNTGEQTHGCQNSADASHLAKHISGEARSSPAAARLSLRVPGIAVMAVTVDDSAALLKFAVEPFIPTKAESLR